MLYLSEEQFPTRTIPHNLKKAMKCGLIVKYVADDLKPHKKYFYSMQECPEEIIITVDDDVVYSPKLVERLYKSYIKHPTCVSACRVHKIKINQGGIAPYNEWQKEYYERLGAESYKLIATGVGGILYPPKVLPKIAFDTNLIKETCLMADDLWLKVMELLSGTKTVLASLDREIHIIENSQEDSLWKTNVDKNNNDLQLQAILSRLPQHQQIINTLRYDVYSEFLMCDKYNPPIEFTFDLPEGGLQQYLSFIEVFIDQVVIAITVKDTATGLWDKIQDFPIINKLKKPKYREALVAIIDQSKNAFFELRGSKIAYTTYDLLDGHALYLHSSGFDDHNLSFIKIIGDSTEVFCFDNNHTNRGLHIAIYSKKKKRIVDFVCIDVHRDSNLIVKRLL